jgi:hypothetical protein
MALEHRPYNKVGPAYASCSVTIGLDGNMDTNTINKEKDYIVEFPPGKMAI